LHIRRPPFGANRIIQCDTVGTGFFVESYVFITRLPGKGDYWGIAVAGFELGNDAFRRSGRIIVEIFTLQRSGPTVEEFDAFRAGLDLGREVFDGGLGQPLQQRLEKCFVFSLQAWAGPWSGVPLPAIM